MIGLRRVPLFFFFPVVFFAVVFRLGLRGGFFMAVASSTEG